MGEPERVLETLKLVVGGGLHCVDEPIEISDVECGFRKRQPLLAIYPPRIGAYDRTCPIQWLAGTAINGTDIVVEWGS